MFLDTLYDALRHQKTTIDIELSTTTRLTMIATVIPAHQTQVEGRRFIRRPPSKLLSRHLDPEWQTRPVFPAPRGQAIHTHSIAHFHPSTTPTTPSRLVSSSLTTIAQGEFLTNSIPLAMFFFKLLGGERKNMVRSLVDSVCCSTTRRSTHSGRQAARSSSSSAEREPTA